MAETELRQPMLRSDPILLKNCKKQTVKIFENPKKSCVFQILVFLTEMDGRG